MKLIRSQARSSRAVIFLALALLLPAASYAVSPSGDTDHQETSLRFDQLPSDLQLVPRDSSNHGYVTVAGSTSDARHVQMEVRVLRQGSVTTSASVPVEFRHGEGSFSLQVPIEAGLFEHRVEVRALEGGLWRTVAVRKGIVAGDVYLIQGQSNAVATDYHFEGLANQNQRNWIRSFGTASLVASEVEADLNWYLADGLGANTSGAIGAWGLKAARLLSETNQVPIAVLNGAVGGTSISFHGRDAADPMNTETNYGRLLFRAEVAGLREAARGLIWYQGESDNGNEDFWLSSFDALYQDWKTDFPGLEKLYVFQIRNACSTNASEMREAQRSVGDLYSDLDVISTMGAPGHDFCHFFFEGYDALGLWLARIMHRDLYGADVDGVDSPNIDFAFFSTPQRDQVTLVFRDPNDSLVLEPGVEDDFILGDGVRVQSAVAVGNTVILELVGPSQATTVRYDGHPFDGPWFTNARGVGALGFTAPLP